MKEKDVLETLGETYVHKPDKEIAKIVKLKRNGKEEFIISPKRGSGGMIFNIYERMDNRLTTPVGELTINAATGTFKGSIPIFK